MNCPKCKENNPQDAYFCHNCGAKLKNKINGWAICSAALIVLSSILIAIIIDCSNRLDFWSRDNYNLQIRIYNLNTQIENKDKQITEMESSSITMQNTIYNLRSQLNERNEEIVRLNNENSDSYYLHNQINSLKLQLPQTYYTKFANQDLYYKNIGGYDKSSLSYPDKGTHVTIYTINDDYGLTEYGWIPMNCLVK